MSRSRNRSATDNIFIFGLTADEVEARAAQASNSAETIAASPALPEVLDEVGNAASSRPTTAAATPVWS